MSTQGTQDRKRNLTLAGLAALALVLLVALSLLIGQSGCVPSLANAGPDPVAAADAGAAEAAPPVPVPASENAAVPTPVIASAVRPEIPGRVSGIVTDAATREPVPWIHVELSGGGVAESKFTGADGTFVSTSSFASGEITARVVDDEVVVAVLTTQHDEERGTRAWRLEVPIGPTIPVAGIDRRVPDATKWWARLVESALVPGVAGEIDVEAEKLTLRAPSAALPDREWPGVRVRSGDVPWVRYPLRAHPPSPKQHVEIELKSLEPMRKGRAPVGSTVGIQRAVEVSTVAFAIVSGNVERAGRPGAEDARGPVRVLLCDDLDAATGFAGTTPEFDEVNAVGGAFQFPDVTPGRKRVFAWSPGGSSVATPLLATPDRVREQSVTLRALEWEDPVVLQRFREKLSDHDPGWRGRLVLAPTEAGGRTRAFVADLEPQDFLAGKPRIPAMPDYDIERVARDAAVTSAGFAAQQWAAHEFRILGAGEAPFRTGVSVTFGPRGGLFTAWSVHSGVLALRRDNDCRWIVWRSGSAPVFGGPTDFQELEDGTRAATVRLEPGWGAQLLLRAGDPEAIARDPWPWAPEDVRAHGGVTELGALGAPPLAGVELWIDGVRAGESDAAGELCLRHPILPRRLTLRCDGWRVCALQKLPDAGQRYVVWMKRAP